ncbi:MAG TPA: type VI secretion system baseplate subunit TssF [Polyangiales bacterium]
MDPRFLGYYERELRHVRELSGEFAREYPKVAERLGLDTFECADPYVERLIEAFAFLTARVQLRMDAEYPEFTQQLLELLYPGYLAPVPSMAVVQLQPNLREASLHKGVVVPRGASLRSRLGVSRTPCEYRTAHAVTLWPIEVASVDYRSGASELAEFERMGISAKASLRVLLRTTSGQTFSQLALDKLTFFFRGGFEPAGRLHEHVLSANCGLIVRGGGPQREVLELRNERAAYAVGFEEEQALLPPSQRTFSGHRLLQEYFAFPERYMFAEVSGLAQSVQACPHPQLELIFLFSRLDPRLEGVVQPSQLALFCTPCINLFPRSADRVSVSERDHEYHVIPDRTRPLDLEVHSVTKVVGHGSEGDDSVEFRPVYAPPRDGAQHAPAFSVRRQLRTMGRRERELSPRANYVPSETYISLSDGARGRFRTGLRQLAVDTLCTNRSLPLQMAIGKGESDFSEQSGAPIEAVRCVAGPTPPRTSHLHGALAWSALSHLSLDFLPLVHEDPSQTAAALRTLLGLYASYAEPTHQKQIDGLLEVSAQNVVRPLPFAGPLTFGRGLEVALTFDEFAFEGTGVFLLGSVLERFLARYASINSFCETVLRTKQRGEVMRWRPKMGLRHPL